MHSAEQQEDSINLRPYGEAVWRRRHLIGLAMLAGTVLFVLYAVSVVLRAPSERTASLQFRLMFTGAAEGRYPNGTPFRPAEILAPDVIAEVFRLNELERFGSVQDFREQLTVHESSAGLDLLAYDFQARLADDRLSVVDRAAIEADYRAKREEIRDPSFQLTLRREEYTEKMPGALMSKVLLDILNTWAGQAQARRGVLKYDVDVLTENVLSRETVQRLDYLVAADRLRAQASRIILTIDALSAVPGASTVRTADGNVSLAEARARLEDVLRFGIEPLMGTIRGAGLTRDPRGLSLYAGNMVFQLELEKREAESRARSLEAALSGYVSPGAPRPGPDQAGAGAGGAAPQQVMPQLTEGFLDRLQRMSLQTLEGEMEYRRKLTDEALAENNRATAFDKELSYYQGLAVSLRGMGSSGGTEMAASVSAQIMQAFDTIEGATKHVAAIYEEMSTQNLNPEARLYTVTAPYTEHTFRSVGTTRLLILYAALMLGTLLVGVVMALASFVARGRKTVAA